jgi:hypothetical protein
MTQGKRQKSTCRYSATVSTAEQMHAEYPENLIYLQSFIAQRQRKLFRMDKNRKRGGIAVEI